MERFHIIEDGAAILVSKGVYRQTKGYHKGFAVFAGWGSGFIRLHANGGTSLPNVRHDGLDIGRLRTENNPLGRLLLVRLP